MYCDGAKRTDDGAYKFETKSWGPSNLILQTLAQQLKEMVRDWQEMSLLFNI